jgi:hypothetical protein
LTSLITSDIIPKINLLVQNLLFFKIGKAMLILKPTTTPVVNGDLIDLKVGNKLKKG